MDSDRQLEIARCQFRETIDALFVFDPRDQRVVDLNPAALRLSGLTRKAALALRVQDLFLSAESDGLQRLIDAFMRTGFLHSSEDYLLVRREGEPIPVNVSVSRIHTKPDPLGLLVARDLRERRKVEEVLDRFFRLSPALFLILGPEGEFLKINPAWEQTLGYTVEELYSLKATDVIHPDDREKSRDAVASLGRGELSGFENRYRHKDGSFRWLSWSAAKVDGLIYAVALDITERKRAEALQQAKDAAELASRAKDRFLAVLSHELRTPLTPVLMAVSGLLEDTTLPSEIHSTLAMIRHNVEMEARLIDDLLDLTRIGRGGLHLELRPTNAHESVMQAAAIYSHEIDTGGLRLVLELAAPAHHVQADPARLQQIVWNLIQNAVKFTPSGGTIRVRTRNEKVQGDDANANASARSEADASVGGGTAGKTLFIEVSDTGIGIEPETLPRIFEAFEQGEDSLRRRSGGLGLGLAISRSLARAHGGSLNAASPGKGQGSTFIVELPTIPAPSVDREAEPATPVPVSDRLLPQTRAQARLRPLRILLVEDNKDTLNCLTRILGQRGHEVRSAGRLSEAKAAAGEGEYDLLLSDIELPDGTGLELMRDLAPKAVRGIAMSGYGSEDDIQQSLAAGYDEHLTKPVAIPRLEEAIRRVMARRG
jgi:PAS domain S-box-containing protein